MRKMDIGGYEYDWRPDYAADLGRHAMVAEASSGVAETDGKVRLTDGESIAIGSRKKEGGPFQIAFALAGTGTLTVRRGETVVATLTAADSPWAFELSSGNDMLTFSYAGEGSADLIWMKSGRGLLILIR